VIQSLRPRTPAGKQAAIIRASHEPKNIDLLDQSFTNSGTTWTLVLLNGTHQGVTGNSRTGRQVLTERVELSFTEQCSANPNGTVRLVVFLDKESRGAAPAWGDLLADATALDIPTAMSPFNFDNVPSRFRILHDTVFSLNNRYTAQQDTQTLRVSIPVKSKTHFYNTSSGNITDIDSGAIYMAVIDSTSTNPNATFYNSRVVFRDV
jgi:hypothetical protein